MNDYLSLTSVVQSYISRSEKPESSFRRLYEIALGGFKWMQLHSTGVPATVEVDVLSNKTAILPNDFLSVINLGKLTSDGSTQDLFQNSDLSILNTTDDERGGERVSYNNIDCYRIDYAAKRVVLNPDFDGDVLVLEYLPVFSESSDDYAVNPFAEEALISYIRWQDSIYDAKLKSERHINRKDFFSEYHNAKRAINKITRTDLYQSYRLSNRSFYTTKYNCG